MNNALFLYFYEILAWYRVYLLMRQGGADTGAMDM
jgi:hypothetical protein